MICNDETMTKLGGLCENYIYLRLGGDIDDSAPVLEEINVFLGVNQ